MAALLLALLGALLLSGCFAGTTPPQDAQGRYVIRMTEANRFEPADARVPAGAVVLWLNVAPAQPAGFTCPPRSPLCHDVAIFRGDTHIAGTNDPARADPLLKPGESWIWTAEAGTYDMFCHTHHDPERMVGTLRVG